MATDYDRAGELLRGRGPVAASRPSVLVFAIAALLLLAVCALSARADDQSQAVPAQSGPSASSPQSDPASTSQTLQPVVVTGTLLSSPSVRYSSPINVIGTNEIQAVGATTIDAALTATPQIVASQDQFSGDGIGLSTVDLRGLGPSRTLVLVDGRRYVTANTDQIVDLNTIPEGLIERVDVVTGGRSAVYGSDALAGVVNFVLRKNFTGFETTAHYGETQYGDGGDLRVTTLLGMKSSDGRGHLELYGEYAKRNTVYSRNRAYAATALQDSSTTPPTLVPGGSSAIVGGRLVGLGNGPSMRFLPDGSLVPYDFNGDAYRPAGDFFNYNAYLDLQVPSDRRIVAALGHYDLSPSIRVYEEAEFVDANSYTDGPPNPGFANPVTLQVQSPFFPASTQAYLASFDPTHTGYVNAGFTARWVDFGNEIFTYDRRDIRTVIGVRGDIGAGWGFDTYFNYGSSNGDLRENSLSQSRLQNALDTAFLDPATGATSPFPFAGVANGGQLVCANAFAQAQGCVPADVFGAGRMSPASISYLGLWQNQNETTITQVANLTVTNNSLVRIPTGGALAAAVGFEWRRESANFLPDEATATGDVISAAASPPVSGSYDVKDAFGELNADLIRNRPGVRLLSANVAARESDYSIATTGKVLSWSAGLAYQPVKMITFRGQYERATRAPNIDELYSPTSLTEVAGIDLCNNAAEGTTLAARCIATGVPTSLIGKVIDPNTQVNDLQGGSPDLQAEKANTYTGGVIIRPPFASTASITLDYYKIDISGYVAAVGAVNVMDLCYEAGLSAYCSRIHRSPIAGNIQYIDDTFSNSGGYKTSGVDFGLDWRPTFESETVSALRGNVDLSSQITYVLDRTLTPVAAISSQTNACAGRFGVICLNPTPKWKAISTATWNHGPVGLSAQWQFIGPVSDDGGLGTPLATEHIPGVSYFNVNGSYKFSGAEVTVGVVNLLNRLPPIMGNNSDANWANSWPATYDTIGRRFFVEGRYEF